MLRCHIYDNQSIIHLLGLPLPCVDPTAMLPAHIWLHGAPLSPGWDLPPVMGHLGGQMKLRLDECFVYYGYGALWRHWQLHIDSLLSRRPTSAVVLFLLFRTQRTNTAMNIGWILCLLPQVLSKTLICKNEERWCSVLFFFWLKTSNVFSLVINLLNTVYRIDKNVNSAVRESCRTTHTYKKFIFSNCNLPNIRH